MPKYDLHKLNSIPILEVAERLGLRTNGRKLIKCFIHSEKTASLSFDIKKNRWRCFGCGASGGVIDLVRQYSNRNFIEACAWLSGENTAIKIMNYVNPISIPKLPFNENKPDCEVYEWIIDNLSINDKGRDYIINQRKFPASIIDDYKIRSFDVKRDKFFKKKCIEHFGLERLLQCGIMRINTKKDNGEKFESLIWYEDGLLFPFYDCNNNVIFIQHRLVEQVKVNKYKGLCGIKLPMYNLDRLSRLSINDSVYICEGVLDCISLNLMGKNAIGIIGSNGFKSDYIDFLKPYTLYLIPDNDTAGAKFTKDITTLLNAEGCSVGIGGNLPSNCKDITDYYISQWRK